MFLFSAEEAEENLPGFVREKTENMQKKAKAMIENRQRGFWELWELHRRREKWTARMKDKKEKQEKRV